MGRHPTLMIVDDSRTSRAIIRKIVTQLRPDWAIREAVSGDEALDMLTDTPPAFISMDMNMPGTNGMDAAREIRARHPDIRIALVTANIQDSVQAEATRIGLCFVKKPVTEAGIGMAISFFEG